MNQMEWVLLAWAMSFIALPSIVAQAYIDRGYFAIGGEWFVPLLAMIVAYFLYEVKNVLADVALVMAAMLWLAVTKAWELASNAVNAAWVYVVKKI